MMRKIITIIIAICVICCAFFLFFQFFYSPISETETDNNFYVSAQGKMIYFDKTISIKKTNENQFDLFDGFKKVQYECESIAKIEDNIIYCNNRGVYLEDVKGVVTEITDSYVERFVANENSIYWIDKTSVLFIYSLVNQSLTKKTLNFGNIEWIDITEDRIYIMTTFKANDIISDEVKNKCEGKDTMLLALDINSFEVIGSFCLNKETSYEKFIPLLLGDQLFYVHRDDSTEIDEVFFVDFVDECSEFVFSHMFITNIVSNNKDIFFSAEKAKYVPFKIPNNDYKGSNGLWKYDLTLNKKIKISDDTVYEDLIATDNFLYCYKVRYIFPRLILEHFNLGYSIEKINLKTG